MCHQQQHRKTASRVQLLTLVGLITSTIVQCCCAADQASRINSKSLRLPPLVKDVNLVKSSGGEKEHQLYLLGLFDLKTSPATICGQFNIDANHDTWQRPMQNLEAFLWAIDQVNADDNLLPDVKLGSIVLDTCSSHLKTVMQLSQFLQDRPQDLGKLPQAHQVAAVINDIADWPTLEATLRILGQIKTTTFVTQSRSSRFERLIQEYHQQESSLSDEISTMFRTSTSNEHLADAVTEFANQMNWTYLSVVYDDRGDMLDLNERLMGKLSASGVEVALNEKVEVDNLWRLFRQLSAKESLGARVVITLVSPAGAQILLNYLRSMRRQQQEPSLQNIGKLLWVTVSDREPYYAAGAEALGTVLISSSASMPENFRSYYNGPQVGKNNRWWVEWSRHERESASKVVCGHSTGCGQEEQHPMMPNARGWEHNGLSVINAVMIAAQGLDLARRASCAATASSPEQSDGQCPIHSSDAINSLPVIIRNNLTDLENGSMAASHADILDGNHFPRYSPFSPEHKPASLADGGEFQGFNPSSNQLVQNFKIYNLRHLQANSIGFVKFGDFNQRQGMRLNAAKARYYSNGAVRIDQPLDSVRSECQNESKCRSPAQLKQQQHHSLQITGNSEADLSQTVPASTGSLFKLDHPAFSEPTSGEADRMQEMNHLYTGAASKHFYTMSTGGSAHFNWSKSPEDRFNVIVLLPLHKTTNNKCQEAQSALDMQAFQWLTAIAYAQEQLFQSTNASNTVHLSTTVIDYCGQEEVAKQLLAAYLESNEKAMQSAHLGEPISLLDFDSHLAETLEKELEEEELTHITFDRPPVSYLINLRSVPFKPEFIFPSEMLEIEALVDLIGRVGGSRWKMVHLIFTDSEEYRDKFLNLAILRGICVNKIISISGKTESASDAQAASNSHRTYQEDISQIFQNNFPAATNETRIIVVLGSSKVETNQLILKSASDSMLDDYAWIVNHNWIQSIEIQAEKSELNWDQGESNHRLPANLIGTRLEAPEDKEFRSFMGNLNPNRYNAQVPATLLDQFWQQNFNCTLPVTGTSLSTATCDNKLQLDPQALEIDYRVPYIIKVIKDLYRTLETHKIGSRNFKEYLVPERYKYGFEIVHRLRSIQTETRRKKQRMQNSRRLVMDSNLPLVTVGSWHLKSRLLLKPELEVLGKNLPGSAVQVESEVYESLHGLSLINSSCNINRSCLSCQKQREHEIAINERNRAKSTLNAKNFPQVVDWLPKLSEQQDGLIASSSSQVFRTASGYEAFEPRNFPPSSSHQTKPQPPNRSIAGRHEYSSINGFGLTEASAITILSLISAIFLLFVMAFLYPSALERKQNSSSRYLTPENLDHQMTSINDYFLFAGLLMLCSINVAFLLPATMTVCWFRRIGLATSYTVILSSILVMVISCYLRRVSKDGKKSSSNQSFDISNVIVANQDNYQAEDEVEVTFESLPQEGTSQNSQVYDTRPRRQESSSNLNIDEKVHNKRSSTSRTVDSPTSLMALLISLITVQILVSLAWSVKQPPEPTLHQGCWRCASPHRSPTLFLYELFLSLVYPALLLLPTWFLSILTFRSVSKDQDQYIKRNILNANQTQQTHSQSTLNKIQRLKGQMRDAKALVLTTTSLIILWSVTTLTMISKSHPLLATTYDHLLHEPLSQRFAESTLVYANLISTFLVYLLLFNYRLQLLGSLRCPSRMLKQHQRTIANEQSCLSDGTNMNHSANGAKTRSKSLLSSSSISSRQELLRLHQFNTYCTYSATSQQLSIDQLGREGYYSASGSQSQRSANKAPLGRKMKKRGRTPFFSLNSSTSATGEPKGSRKQQLEPPSTGGLHRRQSANSVTSSRAQLVFDDSNSISYCGDSDNDDCDINYLDDTISYTSSVASSSTSQLQGNELYPLDYSIQLDATQLAAVGGTNGEGPSRLLNRLSMRRNSSFRNNVKLSSVTEEANEKKIESKEAN